MTIVILWNFWWRIVSYTFFGSSSNYSLCIIIISSVCYPRSAHVLLLLSFGDWPSRAFTWCLRSSELCNCTAIFNNKSSYILLSKKIDLLIWRIILIRSLVILSRLIFFLNSSLIIWNNLIILKNISLSLVVIIIDIIFSF